MNINSPVSSVILGAVFGIVGVVVGAGTTAYFNQRAESAKQQYQLQLDAFKFDQGNYPVEYLQIKMLLDQNRNLSFMSADTVSRLAAIHKKHPDCANTISEKCRPAMVEMIQAVRKASGQGQVPAADIDLLIGPFYVTAIEAARRLNQSSK